MLVVVGLVREHVWAGAVGVALQQSGVRIVTLGPTVWRIVGLKGGNGQGIPLGWLGEQRMLRICCAGTVGMSGTGRGTARSSVGATKPGPEAGKSRKLKDQTLRLGSAKLVVVNDVWVIDSGASHHMCNDESLFLKRSITTACYTIKLGNKTTVTAVLGGLVSFYGQMIQALLVPSFGVSLLSVSQLDESLRWSMTFLRGTCQIQDQQDGLILQVPRTNGLYKLELPRTAEAIHATHTTRSSTTPATWHQRLAHPHEAVLKRILPNIQVSTKDLDCDVCLKGKMKQKFERKPVRRSTRPFELIHSDLCGPMPSSLGGARYYLFYIDDCTRYVEIYLLVTKSSSEIQAKFEVYKAWVEAQGFQIRRFRSDNGTGEYQNSAFLQTLALSGITFEPAPPYTQHKNGVTERMIQTLKSKAWCLLLDAQSVRENV